MCESPGSAQQNVKEGDGERGGGSYYKERVRKDGQVNVFIGGGEGPAVDFCQAWHFGDLLTTYRPSLIV